MSREQVTLAQSAGVMLLVAGVSWATVSIVDYRTDSAVTAQKDTQQDRDIEELRAWRSVAEQALRDCRTRQATGE